MCDLVRQGIDYCRPSSLARRPAQELCMPDLSMRIARVTLAGLLLGVRTLVHRGAYVCCRQHISRLHLSPSHSDFHCCLKGRVRISVYPNTAQVALSLRVWMVFGKVSVLLAAQLRQQDSDNRNVCSCQAGSHTDQVPAGTCNGHACVLQEQQKGLRGAAKFAHSLLAKVKGCKTVVRRRKGKMHGVRLCDNKWMVLFTAGWTLHSVCRSCA